MWYFWNSSQIMSVICITLLYFKMCNFFVCRNSGFLQIRKGVDQQKNSEGRGKTEPSPPDFIFGGIPSCDPSFRPEECCFSLHWNAVQVNQTRGYFKLWEMQPKLCFIIIARHFVFRVLPDSTWLPCITMRMQTDHRPNPGKVFLSTRSTFQRLWRDNAQPNPTRQSQHSVSVDIF